MGLLHNVDGFSSNNTDLGVLVYILSLNATHFFYKYFYHHRSFEVPNSSKYSPVNVIAGLLGVGDHLDPIIQLILGQRNLPCPNSMRTDSTTRTIHAMAAVEDFESAFARPA